MNVHGWITLVVLTLVFALLLATAMPPALIMVGAVAVLLVADVLTVEEAFGGLANEGVLTVAILFVVAAGLQQTRGLTLLTERALGRPRSLREAQTRIILPVALMSGFVNNTPLVAMLMPAVSDWSRRLRFSVSKLMMPLSYASILGGACTLIGTSTNLVINGWLVQETEYGPLGMFEMAWVGLPVFCVGFVYMLTVGAWLLPDRQPLILLDEDPRNYTIEMIVEPGSPVAGKTVEAAGLRHLPNLYLIEIDRDGQVMAAVAPGVELREGDRLVFVGIVESVVDLQNMRGLRPATEQVFKLDEPRTNRCLVEAVVSDTCPLVGQTIREGHFRTRYKAAVIALARNGERISGKMGDIRLRAGDTLLLETRSAFASQQRNSRDFYLVSPIDGAPPIDHARAPAALAILALMVIAVAFFGVPMLKAALVAAGAMILSGCCRISAARSAVDLQVVLVLASALGLGKAIQASELDNVLGIGLQNLVGLHPQLCLASVFVLTSLLASCVTAKAAVVVVLPIASVLANRLNVDLMPFVMAVLMGGATTLNTPIGYPTNLMVLGPGGYRFRDYVFMGTPLTVLIGLVSVILIPMIWPFR